MISLFTTEELINYSVMGVKNDRSTSEHGLDPVRRTLLECKFVHNLRIIPIINIVLEVLFTFLEADITFGVVHNYVYHKTRIM